MKWTARFLTDGNEAIAYPSNHEHSEGQSITLPSDDFVISRKNDTGEVLSFYGDPAWNLKPYAARVIKLDFYSQFGIKEGDPKTPLMNEIACEMKQIMWLFMYEPFHSAGRSVKPSTLYHYHLALRGVGEIAWLLNTTLSAMRSNPIAFHSIMSSIHTGGADGKSSNKGGLLVLLSNAMHFISQKYAAEIPHFLEYKNVIKLSKSLPRQKKKTNSDTKTPLIPSRIYQQLLVDSKCLVDDFLEVSESLLNMITRYSEEPNFWTNGLVTSKDKYPSFTWFTEQFRIRWKKKYGDTPHPMAKDLKWTTPEEAVQEYGLVDFFEKHPISTAHWGEPVKYTWRGLQALISAIQNAARTLTFAYSGQRIHENRVLTIGCLSSLTIKDLGEFPLIMGRTSKMTNNNYSEKLLPWATSHDVIPAINAAEKIAKVALQYIHNRNLEDYKSEQIPLFIGLEPHAEESPQFDFPVPRGFMDARQCRAFYKQLNPDENIYIVTEDDMNELCQFDVYRNWRTGSKVNVNAQWPLTSHQFRRATAVYSARSGDVSLPSLKFQFKHLHLAMAMVYRENALFAQNILAETPEPAAHTIMKDFMDEVNMMMATGFKSHIVDSENPLKGGAGARLQQMKDGHYPKYWDSPEELSQEIKNGTIRWELVPTGGCMKVDTCKHKGIDDVLPCRSGCADSAMGGEDGLGFETGHFLKTYKEDITESLHFVDTSHPSARFIQQEIDAIDKELNTLGALDETA